MLSYTKATLKAKLQSWNLNSAPEFVAELDEIIKRGELSLLRALDLDVQVTENDTTTATLSAEVFKPGNLLQENELWIIVGGERLFLDKRSRAWVKMMGDTPGTPKFYCELDEDRWQVGPPALAAYLIEVTGQFAPASITDGDDDTTTWFSVTVPDLLYIACAIEATEFLKFWTHKTALLEEFGAKVAIYRGETPHLENQTNNEPTKGNPVKGPGQ